MGAEYAAQAITIPFVEDIEISFDIKMDAPSNGFVGNSFGILQSVVGGGRAEAKVSGNSDTTSRLDAFMKDGANNSANPVADDQSKLKFPYDSWIHISMQSRLGGTAKAGATVVTSDLGARLSRATQRSPGTSTTIVFGIGKSLSTTYPVAATYDNVVVKAL